MKKSNIIVGVIIAVLVILLVVAYWPKSNGTIASDKSVTSVTTESQGKKLSTKRTISEEATSRVWKKKGSDGKYKIYIDPSFTGYIDRYNPNDPIYVGGKPNKWLAKLAFINGYQSMNLLDQWLVQKDDEGYHFKDIGGKVNLLQFGDQSSTDPDEFNHWFQVDQWGAADWYYYNPVSGESAIDLDKVPVRQ